MKPGKMPNCPIFRADQRYLLVHGAFKEVFGTARPHVLYCLVDDLMMGNDIRHIIPADRFLTKFQELRSCNQLRNSSEQTCFALDFACRVI